jgi:probable rRNA maturation factor
MPNPSPPTADVLIAADCWQNEANAEAVVQRAIAAAATFVELPAKETELAVMLADDARVRELNREWRGVDKATNVLSFPAEWHIGPDDDSAPRMLGDIAIAYETTRAEAGAELKPFENHLSHLVVHGFLHLLDYDHIEDDEAEVMEGLERAILKKLGIPDPYADKDQVN